jgi:TPR repeat protein
MRKTVATSRLPIVLLNQEAKARDAEAQANLGYLFARGQGVFADQQEALRLYNLSAAQGDGEGMNAVGYKYQYGTGVNKDIGLAVHWYCKAVEAGNGRGMNNLAILLSDGSGVPKDEEQARDLWRQPAMLGHVNAMANPAFSYLQSENARRDQVQGLALDGTRCKKRPTECSSLPALTSRHRVVAAAVQPVGANAACSAGCRRPCPYLRESHQLSPAFERSHAVPSLSGFIRTTPRARHIGP